MKTMEQQALFAIAATILASFLYFIFLDVMKRRSTGKETSFLMKKVAGSLLLGFVPAVLAWWLFRFGPMQAGLLWHANGKIWLWTCGASLFFILLNLFNSRNAQLQSMYPELRKEEWGMGRLMLTGGGWVLYLAGYEYLFRGLLLFTCYEAFGLWPAVVINLALYSALHLPKGMKEAIAAIPFGALICYLTLESQSLLPAIIIHSVQAVSCEISCIWRNPEMKFNIIK